ncbi:hypothetical protein JYU34_006125 [Plutella xylostella]|uniref:Uncharacterized protein n=1 Tax=Plutella xylostella TaxID=51655 RepID=A0ABQ7QV13_PLUXY|nr:hypothetical protein JYU34_006125 [Plutella xylostella]
MDPAGGGRARPAREARPLFLFYNPYSGDLLPGSGLDSFANKRSFDEIDNSMMPFPHAKRFLRYYRPTFLGAPDFDRKRTRADYPMDEIDVSQFPIGSKRSEPFHNLAFR